VAYAARAGAEAVLVVLADLPFLSTEAMEALLACSHGGREVVIAPGQRGGTHALLVRPPAWLQFSFGPDSLRTHLKQVVKARARLALYEELALTFDIDLPEDLRKVATLDPDLLRCVAARRDDKEDRYEN
jgi:2-phospho-L-lactate guanylyltransferase